MSFFLSARSRARLIGVHPDLVRVVENAIIITRTDFSVVEGVRTLEAQRRYFALGKSKTMRSRHLPSSNACGMSCAVDLCGKAEENDERQIVKERVHVILRNGGFKPYEKRQAVGKCGFGKKSYRDCKAAVLHDLHHDCFNCAVFYSFHIFLCACSSSRLRPEVFMIVFKMSRRSVTSEWLSTY